MKQFLVINARRHPGDGQPRGCPLGVHEGAVRCRMRQCDHPDVRLDHEAGDFGWKTNALVIRDNAMIAQQLRRSTDAVMNRKMWFTM